MLLNYTRTYKTGISAESNLVSGSNPLSQHIKSAPVWVWDDRCLHHTYNTSSTSQAKWSTSAMQMPDFMYQSTKTCTYRQMNIECILFCGCSKGSKCRNTPIMWQLCKFWGITRPSKSNSLENTMPPAVCNSLERFFFTYFGFYGKCVTKSKMFNGLQLLDFWRFQAWT